MSTVVDSITVRYVENLETVSDRLGGAAHGAVYYMHGEPWWLSGSTLVRRPIADYSPPFRPTDCIWMVPVGPESPH